MNLLENTGIFLYPLAACSLLALFVAIERTFSLRRRCVLPEANRLLYTAGKLDEVPTDEGSAAGRIALYATANPDDLSAVRAYAQVEVTKMERGLFLLETVIGAAPLIGLLGTMTGLTQVFDGLSFQAGADDSEALVAGIALALNTTILGLVIAIPSLAVYAYLNRKIDKAAALLWLGIEAATKPAQAGRIRP